MIIKTINPDDPTTWEGKFFVEIDVDWAAEAVIEDTIRLLEEYQVPATFFATHRSGALSNIQNSSQFEIGLHPNFVPLLRGDNSLGKDFKEVMGRLMDIYPDAKSCKAHSLVDSSVLLQHYSELGITHDNTYFIDFPGIGALKPWWLWNNLVRVPLYWEDDYACVTPYVRNFDKLLNVSKGLKVFGFHPIHVFLNLESLDRWAAVKGSQNDVDRLLESRFEGEGTRTKFLSLLKFLSGR